MTIAISRLKQMLPLSRQAEILARLVPARFWFRCAIVCSRLQGRIAAKMGGDGKLTELVMRDHWLREFTDRGRFPLPMRVAGREVLDEYLPQGPVLYCTMHIGMSDMPLRFLVDQDYAVPVPIAHGGRMVAGERYPVTGMNLLTPALMAGPHVLSRARTLLLRGTSVACLAERNYTDGEFNANPLRLAARLRVPLIFTWATLARDGVIDVEFRAAPHPYCDGEAEMEENLNGLLRLRDTILASIGLGPAADRLPRPQIQTARTAKGSMHSPAA
jgi:hypothetical protein